jgi:copper chaperone
MRFLLGAFGFVGVSGLMSIGLTVGCQKDPASTTNATPAPAAAPATATASPAPTASTAKPALTGALSGISPGMCGGSCGGSCGAEGGCGAAAAAPAPTWSTPTDAAWTELSVTGMHCGGCARRVERALSQVAGVLGVEVDLGKATVKVATAKGVDGRQLTKSTIDSLGYRVQ